MHEYMAAVKECFDIGKMLLWVVISAIVTVSIVKWYRSIKLKEGEDR